jgi:hypothetical protein
MNIGGRAAANITVRCVGHALLLMPVCILLNHKEWHKIALHQVLHNLIFDK